MEKRILTAVCLILFFITVGLSLVTGFVILPKTEGLSSDNRDGVSLLSQVKEYNPVFKEDRDFFLRLTLPRPANEDFIALEEDIVRSSVNIYIDRLWESYFEDFPIEKGKRDNPKLRDIVFYAGGEKPRLSFRFDHPMTCRKVIKGKYLYLEFLELYDAFSKVVVIDAGSGGEDFGKGEGEYTEKDLNLDILLRIKEIFDKNPNENIGVFYTRTSDVFYTLDERADFANNISADIFVSVQQNSTSSGRISDINGTEVLYYSQDPDGGSRDIARRLLTHLTTNLGSTSRGISAGDDSVLLRALESDAVIVKVGYLSNEAERAKLSTEEYRQLAAEAVYNAIMESVDEDSNSHHQ